MLSCVWHWVLDITFVKQGMKGKKQIHWTKINISTPQKTLLVGQVIFPQRYRVLIPQTCVTVYRQRVFVNMIKNLRWGDFHGLFGLNAITSISVWDAETCHRQ